MLLTGIDRESLSRLQPALGGTKGVGTTAAAGSSSPLPAR